ncbi:MAG: MarR family transcriptional regulator [Actinobacteria bacterium]|nr:MarR family transcriptional regulator [Actinomycetota bacterium]
MTRWLDDEEMTAWRSLIETGADLFRALELDLAEHGLTQGDYQVLVYLSESDGDRLRMTDLACRLQLTPSGLTRRLDRLIASGLVERMRSEDDGRVMLAVMTPSGRRLLERTAPHHVESVRRHMIDLLDREELRAIGSSFGKIRQHLDDRAGNGDLR